MRDLASAWLETKTAELELQAERQQALQERLDNPSSLVESVWDNQEDRFKNLKAIRKHLKQYHKVRVSGGIIATLLEIRSLMVFGVGGVFTAEQDEVSEWLNTQLDDIDTLLFDIGTDAYFYGYSLAEVRETVGGDFGEVTLIQPWTTVPVQDAKGEVLRWEQKVSTRSGTGGNHEETFQPDEVLHFRVMKSSGRDNVGMSLLGRAMEEAESFRDNQRAIKNAVQLHGFPKYHVQVGREDGAPPDDNELRRLRPQFDNVHELTKWITGKDVDIETVGAEGFEFEGITTHDLSKLALAFMLPIELTQITGGDGLGTGFPARVRERMFLLSAQAHQSLMSRQLVEQVAKPLLAEYGPVPEDQVDDLDLGFSFEDPIVDVEKTAQKLGAVGDDMTVNERRDLAGLEPIEGSDGEQFARPAVEEESEAKPDTGGLFASGGRRLQSVPENAVPIGDRSEAPEGASIVEGPRGGTYYVPGGDGPDGDNPFDESWADAGAPDGLDPTNAESVSSLSDLGLPEGENAGDMKIAEMPDGSRLFVKQPDIETGSSPQQAVAGSVAFDEMGIPAPDAAMNLDTGEVSVEGVDGQTFAEDTSQDYDKDSYLDAVAGSLLTGNGDIHGGNLLVDEDGQVVPIDQDKTASVKLESVDNPPGNSPLDQAVNVSTTSDGPAVSKDEVVDRMESLAGDIDLDSLNERLFEAGADIEGEIIAENIESAREGGFP